MTRGTSFVFFLLGSWCIAGCGSSSGSGSGGSGGGGGTQKTTPTVSAWPTASAITYGQTLASSALTGGTASTTGTFAWETPALVPPTGAQGEWVTFTPADTTEYNTVTTQVGLTVNKATPTVSAWPIASTITSIQTLASSVLTGGTASTPGTFAWTTPSTAPPVGTDSESVTFTATDSTDYNTVAGSVTVTVSLAPIVISGISPNWYFTPTALSSPLTTITGSGFAGGELFYFSGYPNPSTVSQGNPATTITYVPNVQMRPRFVNFYGTQADGTGKSNTVAFATFGTVPIAAACNDYIFADSQGTGTIRRFNRTGGTSTDFSASAAGGIAADCNSDGTTNFVVLNDGSGGTLGWTDKTGNGASGGVAGDGNTIVGTTANNHVACTIEPSMHEAWCAKLVAGASVQKFSPAIGTPEALAMTGACGGTTLFVLDAQGDGTNPVLYSFSVGTDGTLTGGKSLPLPGFTPVSKFTQAELENFVNWQVSASQTSCTAAVMAPVLNASAGTVSFALAVVNGTTMTETTTSVVALPSGSFQISEDDVHSATLIYVADVSGTSGVSRTWSRPNTASGALTQLSSTSTILNVGPILSLDGSTIGVIGWDPANDSAGLQLQSVPNK